METDTPSDEYGLPLASEALVGFYSSIPFRLAFAVCGALAAGLVGISLSLGPL